MAKKTSKKLSTVKPKNLLVRCFAEKKGNVWQAFCIDLNLAAQGSSFNEVKRKLHAQIAEYVYDALAGVDREFADQLLSRKAPLSIRIRYHVYAVCSRISTAGSGLHKLFKETLPLVPQHA